VAKVGTSKAGGTISQQAVVHPWLGADAHGNKQTNKQMINITPWPIYPQENNAVGRRTGDWVNPRGLLHILEKTEDSRFCRDRTANHPVVDSKYGVLWYIYP
jgi:hypothetical protein